MALVMLNPQEMGERVWKAYRVSGYETATAFAKAMREVDPTLESVNRNLLGDLRHGHAKITQRLPLIATVVAGTGSLIEETPDRVLAYLRGDLEFHDLIVKFPPSGGFTTLDRVKESRPVGSKVTEGSGVS